VRTPAQTLMEWPPLVRVYESRFWRRSPVFAAFFGISFEREYALIADAANLEPDALVLDLACGPGIYARPFARAVPRGQVIGLDLSVPMLRYAADRAREEGLTNLRLLRGDATRLPFRDGVFQAANCCGALHLFPDPARTLAEMHRVLGAGGSVTLAVFRNSGSALGKLGADVRRRLLGVASFDPDGLTTMLASAGFVRPRVLHAAGAWLVVAASRA
jgi:ubiquinone/menaquinone biosynthesis C-methylase UbiE